MGDLLKSVVRTFVPVIVGLIIATLAKAGIEVDDTALTTVIDGVAVGAYYALIRFLETKNSSFGWLLGLPSPPHYQPPDVVIHEPDQ